MTTDELIADLKSRGVAEDYAEGFRDLHIQSAKVGQQFKMPVVTCDDSGNEIFLRVTAEFTGEDEDYVPRWLEVT